MVCSVVRLPAAHPSKVAFSNWLIICPFIVLDLSKYFYIRNAPAEKYLDSVQESREIFALSVQIADFSGEPVRCAIVASWETDGLERFVFQFVGVVMHPCRAIGQRRRQDKIGICEGCRFYRKEIVGSRT